MICLSQIQEVSEPPYIVNPLSVAGKPEKPRLVLDCRSIHLKQQRVSIEGADILVKFIKKGGFLITFDILSGYYHVPVHPEFYKFLGFAFPDDTGCLRYFQFEVLPFGLASATHIFTKVLREFIRVWRAQAIENVDEG